MIAIIITALLSVLITSAVWWQLGRDQRDDFRSACHFYEIEATSVWQAFRAIDDRSRKRAREAFTRAMGAAAAQLHSLKAVGSLTTTSDGSFPAVSGREAAGRSREVRLPY